MPSNTGQFDNTLANAATVARQYTGPPNALFRATLRWVQDNSDVDLYVTEPAPSGETAWYSNHTTSHGLNLDFDNTSGRGPENTTLPAGSTPLAGNYVIKVHYYSDHGTGQTTNGTVDIVLYEHDTTGKSKKKTFEWNLAISGAQGQSCCNQNPGSDGFDWWILVPPIDVRGDNIP
jgi:uncharacterized protein YfaP (DUF2135 family)